MTKEEALMLALDALENTTPTGFNMERDKQFFAAITAIKEALAQQEQEPVALQVGWVDDGGTVFWKDKPPADGADIYTSLPQRKWVGLTDEEISAIDWKQNETLHDFARAIEAKLKEKNT